MIDRLLAFLSGGETPDIGRSNEDPEFSVAALLIEAGRMDKSFDSTERATIERLLAEKFDLAPYAVQSLIEAAEQRMRDSVQYYPFTREICKRLSAEERVEIIEML
jgi:uncharacterized tellurite resistance protein B-like protein